MRRRQFLTRRRQLPRTSNNLPEAVSVELSLICHPAAPHTEAGESSTGRPRRAVPHTHRRAVESAPTEAVTREAVTHTANLSIPPGSDIRSVRHDQPNPHTTHCCCVRQNACCPFVREHQDRKQSRCQWHNRHNHQTTRISIQKQQLQKLKTHRHTLWTGPTCKETQSLVFTL